MSSRLRQQPNEEQIAAIVRFAKANGRSWRVTLWAAWMNGYSRCVVPQDGDEAHLQQLRNQLGPSWLDSFKLPKATPAAVRPLRNIPDNSCN